MKKKASKITVATRIPQTLRDDLDKEAWQQGLSFCAYLEKLIKDRNQSNVSLVDVEDSDYSMIKNERDELLELVGTMEYEKDMGLNIPPYVLKKEQELEKRIQELEEDYLTLEIEKKKLERKAESNELALEEAVILPYTEATEFLKEKFPALSKEELIYHCLEVAGINETKDWIAYRLSDYLNRNLVFNNHEN